MKKLFVGKLTKRLLILAAIILMLQALSNSCGAIMSPARGQSDMGAVMLEGLAAEVEEMLYNRFVPGIVYEASAGHGTYWLLQEQIDGLFPFYGYLTGGMSKEDGQETLDFRTIFLAEADEGTYQQEEDNQGEDSEPGIGQEQNTEENDSLADLLAAENAAAQTNQSAAPIAESFVPHDRINQVDTAALTDYEILLAQFYSVDKNTSAGSDRLDVSKFLERDISVSKDAEGPQILIFHTHSQEGFADSVPGDESTTIVGAGEQLANILSETYGYQVLHHTGQYDVEVRDDAYGEALPEIEQLLKDNPSIQVVIDLHRDQMPEEKKLVMDLDGRPTARFMFFNGLSRTKKTGNIAYLYNENLDANLAFSFQMQLKAMEYYPGITRKIYLKGYRYNMHLNPNFLLVELGAQNNTVEEAMNACDPLAHILDLVLSGQ